MVQMDLFGKTHQQEFDAWKDLAGSRQVLRRAYAIAAVYGARYVRTKQRASVGLIWELLRDHLDEVRLRCRRAGVDLARWKGYTLNNNHRAYLARHIEAHRPQWTGMFETREVGKVRGKRKVLVITERSGKGAS